MFVSDFHGRMMKKKLMIEPTWSRQPFLGHFDSGLLNLCWQ
jgi:hypothetical protein